MTNPNKGKKWSNYKVIIQVGMRMHNPQVIQAYRYYLDAPDNSLHIVLLKYLKIYPDNSILEVLLKLALFYLVDGRLWVQSSTPMWYPQKAETFKPQLTIQYRPQGQRKRFSYGNYAGNPELHIPHYNGDATPTIPAYTIGKFSAKYTLKDKSYILVNASSTDEAVAVVTKMASYTRESKRPKGEISENIITTNRIKTPRMNGIKIEPYKGEYFTGGRDGLKGLVRLQF